MCSLDEHTVNMGWDMEAIWCLRWYESRRTKKKIYYNMFNIYLYIYIFICCDQIRLYIFLVYLFIYLHSVDSNPVKLNGNLD